MFHMIVRKIFSLLSLVLSCAAMGQTITPEIEKRAVELVAQMTLEEKLAYIGGYNGFFIRPIPRLGIPEIRMADGPRGFATTLTVRCIHAVSRLPRHGTGNWPGLTAIRSVRTPGHGVSISCLAPG